MSKVPVRNTAEVFYEGGDLEALYAMRRYRQWMMTYFEPCLRGEVVEIGAGVGTISEHVLPFVSALDLVEPAASLIEPLTSRCGHLDKVSIIHQRFEDFILAKPSNSCDCVIMVNVLEHIEDDRAALRECYRILRPGGYLLLFVPALRFLFSKLDQMVGHYRRYERSDFRAKIREAEFQVMELKFFDSAGILPWWLFNTIGGATAFNPQMIGLYDAAIVPVTRFVESVVTPPIGKNLIAVSKRPE